jgi:hypothetical protein
VIFFEWRIVGFIICGLLAIAGAAALFWSVRRKRWPVRIPVRLLSVPIGLAAALFLVLMWVGSGCVSYSTPIYSPDGEKAARIQTDDEGATGGNSSVEVFEAHGWDEENVYWGDWRSIEPDGVHWIDNSHLRIEYDNVREYHCDSSRRVVVECVPRLEPVH